MVFRRRFIGQLTLEPGEQYLINRIELESECHERINSTRFSQCGFGSKSLFMHIELG